MLQRTMTTLAHIFQIFQPNIKCLIPIKFDLVLATLFGTNVDLIDE